MNFPNTSDLPLKQNCFLSEPGHLNMLCHTILLWRQQVQAALKMHSLLWHAPHQNGALKHLGLKRQRKTRRLTPKFTMLSKTMTETWKGQRQYRWLSTSCDHDLALEHTLSLIKKDKIL
jgi:hypothetical protein